MSTGAIVAIVVLGLLTTGMVALRVAVAKQRGDVEAVRARLAAAGPAPQRAEGVEIESLFHMRGQVARSKRVATCARTNDGFYCLSDDGRLGWRIPFGSGAPQRGDVALATAPCLVSDGTVVAPGELAEWLVPALGSLPPEGLILQQKGGSIVWIIAVPRADEWWGALMLGLKGPGSKAPAATT